MLSINDILRVSTLSTLCVFLALFSSCMGRQGPRKAKKSVPATSYDDNGRNEDGPAPINLLIPHEVSHCQWFHENSSFPSTSSLLLGGYSVCQSSFYPTKIFFQLQTPPSFGEDICIIPINHRSNGDLLYIGDIKCKGIFSSSEIYKFRVESNRKNFSNFPITGVLIMRDREFLYPSPYSGLKTSSAEAYDECLEYVERGDNRYCEVFEQVGQFVPHKFQSDDQ